ncbi:transglycosylase domain-containing protein [Bacillus fonticola]|uniref:transglycosylase domain-containing protein n=1 Tax=Bacillus fonticola TaxID=2728853 RepID=UPI001472F332|nr:transglycosylase domain-containing protein [Bacillus fonticola]
MEEYRQERSGRRRQQIIKWVRATGFIGGFFVLLMLIAVGSLWAYLKVQGPPPLSVPQSTLYYAADGTVIGEENFNGEKRYWVPIEEMSPALVNATVAIEDRNFYEHNGFDIKRIAGAAIADLKALDMVQGASTITMQYARNLFLEHDKTWERKIKETVYALRLEMNYDKDQILEGYLNTIYYGHGAYGIQAASQFYFGKDADELSLAESTMLAGIPKGPSNYSPLEDADAAKSRQKLILQEMAEQKLISAKELAVALREPLSYTGTHPTVANNIAPYFQDAVRAELQRTVGIDEKTLETGGLQVYTTLDPKMQKIAERAVEETMEDDSNMQLGFVAMSPNTGFVRAMVGGRDYQESPFNRATQAIRQPGSTIKPLLYYAALEQGFTPATSMQSEQTTFLFDEGRAEYTPHNFNNKYAEDDVTLAQALALSDNVYAVKTHLFMGTQTLVDTMRRFGISTKIDKVPSLALGTSGVRVTEMTNTYNMFANGGKDVRPQLIEKVVNRDGEVLYEAPQSSEQTLKKDRAFLMTSMMTGMFDRALNGYSSVTGTTVIDDITRAYAGKSGSTDTDSWMIGFAPQLTAGVWTGYDDGRDITNVTEKQYAKNIWVTFMEEALEGSPVKAFRAPEGVVGVYVNPATGKLATEACPTKRLTYFIEGTEPTEYCIEHLGRDDKTDEAPEEEESDPKDEPIEEPWYKKLFDWIG